MTRFKQVDGIRRQMNAEEEVARDAEEAQEAIDRQARIDTATTKETNKTSGKAKLKSGDALSDAEILALFGA